MGEHNCAQFSVLASAAVVKSGIVDYSWQRLYPSSGLHGCFGFEYEFVMGCWFGRTRGGAVCLDLFPH